MEVRPRPVFGNVPRPGQRCLARSQFGAFAGELGPPVPWHDASVSIVIRPAEMSDEDALTRIEQETSSLEVSPIVFPPRPFFQTARPEDVLVSLRDAAV